MSLDNPAADVPTAEGISSNKAAPVEGVSWGSVLLRKQPDPALGGDTRLTCQRGWTSFRVHVGQTWRRWWMEVTSRCQFCFEYRAWTGLLSEQKQFSSATMQVFVELDGLPHGITMGPWARDYWWTSVKRLKIKCHLSKRASYWQKISPTSNMSKCTDNFPNNQANRLVKFHATIPRRLGWRKTIRDMIGWKLFFELLPGYASMQNHCFSCTQK